MSLKRWEKKVLSRPGAARRIAELEDELRLAAGLTALREDAGLSQRDLAKRMGISQPRVAAIEQSRNVTIDVLEQYVDAVGGKLQVTVVKGRSEIPLIAPGSRGRAAAARHAPKRKTAKTAAKRSAGVSEGRRASRST